MSAPFIQGENFSKLYSTDTYFRPAFPLCAIENFLPFYVARLPANDRPPTAGPKCMLLATAAPN